MDRLLTDEEIIKATASIPHLVEGNIAHHRVVLGRRVANAEHSKTLKAVGEWLESRWVIDGWCILEKEMEALKRGEMPKE